MRGEQEKMQDNKKDSCCSSERLEPKKVSKFQDCGIEEQVLRLHAVVRSLQQSSKWSYNIQCSLQTKLHALEHHQHSSNGDCMLRIEDITRGNNENSGGLSASIDYLD